MDIHSVAARYASGAVLKRAILGCGVVVSETKSNRLVISDLHLPYHHRDAFDFLEAVSKEFDCEEILNTGDVIDNHQGSYHESEPDAPDAETEYELAKVFAMELEGLFPEMTITSGNHDRIPARKLKTVGLPSSMVGDYNAIYGLSGG